MTAVQRRLLELLLDFDEICNKHEIIYYMGGGTALGAVRNGGFLPWDNDLDIYITRNNYLKLLEIIYLELPPNRLFVTAERYPLYQNVIPRFVDIESTKLYFSTMLDGHACGQHLELLIFDPFPCDQDDQRNYRELLQVYCELMSSYLVINRQTSKHDHAFNYKLYREYCDKIEINGRDNVLHEIEEKLFTYSDEDVELYCMRWGIQSLIYDKKYFGKPRLIPFEGYLLPVCEKAECIFRLAFGDTWMFLPSKSNQKPKASGDSLKEPFEKYVIEFNKGLDKDKVLEEFWKYKNAKVHFLMRSDIYQKLRAQEGGSKQAEQLSDKYFRVLQECADPKKTETTIKSLCKSYIRKQFSTKYKKWEVFLDIDEGLLIYALDSLILSNAYYRALYIFKLRNINGKLLSTELEQRYQVCQAMKELSIAIYDEYDEDTIFSLSEQWYPQYPLVPLFAAGHLLWAKQKYKEQEEFLIFMTKNLLAEVGHDGLVLKSAADIFWEFGNKKEAMKIYERLLAKSTNAIILRETKKWKAAFYEEALESFEVFSMLFDFYIGKKVKK